MKAELCVRYRSTVLLPAAQRAAASASETEREWYHYTGNGAFFEIPEQGIAT